MSKKKKKKKLGLFLLLLLGYKEDLLLFSFLPIFWYMLIFVCETY